eukprot:scaffold50476_cov63-Phaeocystis_antarctica.AAC.3
MIRVRVRVSTSDVMPVFVAQIALPVDMSTLATIPVLRPASPRLLWAAPPRLVSRLGGSGRAVVHRDGEVAHVLANRCDHVDVGIAGEASNCGELAVDASRRLAVGTRRRVGDGIGGEDHGTWDAGLADLGDGQVHAYAACSGAGEVAVGHGVVGVVVVGRLDSSVVGVGAIDVLGGEGEVAQPATVHDSNERKASKKYES